jgi:FkbM family methyltransferase
MDDAPPPPPRPLETFDLHGVRLTVASGRLNDQLRAALVQRRYVAPEARALGSLLTPEDVYFEVGSSAGILSTLAYRVVRDKARVHVYEPEPRMAALVKRTWRTNGADGSVHECLLGAGPGEYPYYVAKAFWASSRLADYGHGTTIQVQQRDFLQQLDKRGATFLLVEAQGAERDLLDKVLSPKVRAIVARLHPRIAGEVGLEAVLRCIAEQGFRQVSEDGPTRAWVRG